MIKNESVERALHRWEPWVKAVEDGRGWLCSDATAEASWDYAGAVLKTLRLPAKATLRVYFLSCVFSSYKHGERFVFSEIRPPPLEKWKPPWSRESTGRQVEVRNLHPLPPAILTKKDAYRLLNYCRDFRVLNMSPSEAIRKIYAPGFMVLDQEHPVRQIGSKMKRCMSPDIAITCANLKESMTHKEIGDKFGWAIQKGAYGQKGTYVKRNRCSTARRYVRVGRKLTSTLGPLDDKIPSGEP